MQTEIKNVVKSSADKVPKFNLKINAYLYNLLLYFLPTEIRYETFTTNSFFINVHRLIEMKVHLHHSHVTDKILGSTHDFCNAKVTEKSAPDIPVIGRNLFGFDLYYFIKDYIASAWCSKELSIGRINLTHINFSNITGEIKFIDSLKYYQKNLAELASTSSEEEITEVKKLTEQFFLQHYYFSTAYLNSKKKEKILDILEEGKDVISYQVNINLESFFLTPEDEFW